MTTRNDNFQSSGLAAQVDGVMDIMYAGGVNNPADSVEQISYLLFLKLLWEKDNEQKFLNPNYEGLFNEEWAKYGWGNISNLTGDEMFDTVRDAIESIAELPELSSTGKLLFRQATLKILDRPTLRAVIQGIDNMDTSATGIADPKGDMYEYLLSKIAASGTNGQFRTPRHIIDAIVEMIEPKAGESICDPAAGSAGFLLAAHDYILESNTPQEDIDRGDITGSLMSSSQWEFQSQDAYTGFDNDANMVKFGIMNLYLHNLENSQFEMFNSITTSISGSYPGRQFDVILANPPFAGRVQAESILTDLNHGLDTKSTQLLFGKWFVDHLNQGGRAGVIVPQGVLFGSSRAHSALKKSLLEECSLEAVIDLPSGVFNPYSGVNTAILIFKKGEPTKSVWFYKVNADGYTLNANRTPIDENDIPDLVAKFKTKEESDNSVNVPVQQIIDNDSLLNINMYLDSGEEEIEYAPPTDILQDIQNIEAQIQEQIKLLEADLS